jgi:hypothetical protein
MSKKSEKKKLEKNDKKLKKEAKKGNKGKRKTASISADITPQQRLEMIATAAYYIAERHGFTPGESKKDWRAAEKEIDKLLKKGRKKGKKKD